MFQGNYRDKNTQPVVNIPYKPGHREMCDRFSRNAFGNFLISAICLEKDGFATE